MAVKFEWSKYQSGYPKLPDQKKQWDKIIRSEREIWQEALKKNQIEEAAKKARIKGQKEGLRIIGEEVAPFARYVIRNPKGNLVGMVNTRAQLEDQLYNLNINPNEFNPEDFNAEGKQKIGKYRVYDNEIRGEKRDILKIARPEVIPLAQRINMPFLINSEEDEDVATRASSVPPDEKRIEEWIEEMKKEGELGGKEEIIEKGGLKDGEPGIREYQGIKIDLQDTGGIYDLEAKIPEYGGLRINYRKGRPSGAYGVVKQSLYYYGDSLNEAMSKAIEDIAKRDALRKWKATRGRGKK